MPEFELWERGEKCTTHIRTTDLLVLPNTNRSGKHNVRKAVEYACECVYIHTHTHTHTLWEGEEPRMGEFPYKSRSNKIGPTDFQIGERG